MMPHSSGRVSWKVVQNGLEISGEAEQTRLAD
jgi:hypothetical protein